jgi:hypothetical protein
MNEHDHAFAPQTKPRVASAFESVVLLGDGEDCLAA